MDGPVEMATGARPDSYKRPAESTRRDALPVSAGTARTLRPCKPRMQPPASGDGHAHPASKRRNAMTVGVVIGRSPRRGFLRTAVGGFSMPPIVGWIRDIL